MRAVSPAIRMKNSEKLISNPSLSIATKQNCYRTGSAYVNQFQDGMGKGGKGGSDLTFSVLNSLFSLAVSLSLIMMMNDVVEPCLLCQCTEGQRQH